MRDISIWERSISEYLLPKHCFGTCTKIVSARNILGSRPRLSPGGSFEIKCKDTKKIRNMQIYSINCRILWEIIHSLHILIIWFPFLFGGCEATHFRASLTRTGHRRQGKQQWDAHQGWGLWYNGATRPYPILRIDWDHAICFHRIQLVGTVPVLRYRHSLLRRDRLWVSPARCWSYSIAIQASQIPRPWVAYWCSILIWQSFAAGGP